MKKKYSIKEAKGLIEKALLAVEKVEAEPNTEFRSRYLKLTHTYLNEMKKDLQDLSGPPMDYGITRMLLDCWHNEPLRGLLFKTEDAFLYVQEHKQELNSEQV